MKRNILKQIRNEWRDNTWIVLGLSIVTLAIWLFCSALFNTMKDFFIPLGFDEKDVYVLSIGALDSNSPTYADFGEETKQKNNEDLRALLSLIRKSPNVEAAGFSYFGTPYKRGSYNASLFLAEGEIDSIGFKASIRIVSPEVVRVLHLKSLTGKDEDYLQKKLEKGEILLSPDPHYDPTLKGKDRAGHHLAKRDAKDLVGHYMIRGSDSINKYRVADIIPLVRRYRYDREWTGGAIVPINESSFKDMHEIIIRVKPGCGDKFREEFESTPEMISRRNVYLYNYTKLSDMGKTTEREDLLDVRLFVALIGFFLIILFLGLLGTFWFRMQQRVSEIAIRRVCGASRWDIFRRVLGEGMILLIGATVLAGIVGWIIIKKTDLIQGFTTIQIICFEGATMLIVALGIVVSIVYPAWRAMSIEPAVAVRDE